MNEAPNLCAPYISSREVLHPSFARAWSWLAVMAAPFILFHPCPALLAPASVSCSPTRLPVPLDPSCWTSGVLFDGGRRCIYSVRGVSDHHASRKPRASSASPLAALLPRPCTHLRRAALTRLIERLPSVIAALCAPPLSSYRALVSPPDLHCAIQRDSLGAASLAIRPLGCDLHVHDECTPDRSSPRRSARRRSDKRTGTCFAGRSPPLPLTSLVAGDRLRRLSRPLSPSHHAPSPAPHRLRAVAKPNSQLDHSPPPTRHGRSASGQRTGLRRRPRGGHRHSKTSREGPAHLTAHFAD